MYYASFGILSIIIHLIINFDVLRKSDNASNFSAKIPYRRFLFTILIYYVSDVLWGILFEQKLIVFVFIDTTVYFAAMVLSVFFWTKFVIHYLERNNVMSRFLTYSGWIIMGFEAVALAMNLFIPIVFSFDEQGNYYPGQARYITLAVQILLFFLTSVYALVVSKKEQENKLHFRMIAYSGIVMTVFIILQTMYPLIPFYAIGCLLATCLIHTFILQDTKAEYHKKLGMANLRAYRDSLTGVKNKYAYDETVSVMNDRIGSGELKEFGVIVFDLNGLKEINDSQGHEAGDRYIKEASRLICHQFIHSTVFRIGGDEFVAILEGTDYQNRDMLFNEFNRSFDGNQSSGHVVISCGLAVYDPQEDDGFEAVFMRGDKLMYERKKELKKIDRQAAL